MLIFVFVILVVYAFTFINGWHDGCNIIATTISSRSMEAKKALNIATIMVFISPIISGTAVAVTMGKGIVKNEFIQSNGVNIAYVFILCSIIGAIIWNIITWRLGLPSSTSHSLIGGLIGSAVCIYGINSVDWFNVLIKVVLVIFLTPVLGFIIGLLLMLITKYACRSCKSNINEFFKTSQIFSMSFLAISYGANDAQKSMGIVTLILTISGIQNNFYVPLWVKVTSAALMALGVYLGGWKIVSTVGKGIFKVKPVHSFVSQVSAASIIFLSGLIGAPVSISQIVSSSIMGVGAGEKLNAVRWSTVKNILTSWITTIPCAALISIFLYFIVILF